MFMAPGPLSSGHFAARNQRRYSGVDILVKIIAMSRPIILLAGLVCVAAGLRVANFSNVNTRTPDERVYTYQAKTWLESGRAGIRSMVDEYKGDAETRWYPPPTGAAMKAWGRGFPVRRASGRWWCWR